MVIRRRLSGARLILLFAAVFGPVACTADRDRSGPEPRPALVALAQGAERTSAGFSGVVRARERATLAVAVSGRVTRVQVDLGDPVRRGQPLLSLDTTAIDGAVKAAQATVVEAESVALDATRRFERVQAVIEAGAASPAEFGSLKAEAEAAAARTMAARAALKEARWRLDQSQIRAPLDGVIAVRHVEPGQVVAEGMPVFEIDGQGRELVLDLPESVVLQPGEAVSVEGPRGTHDGKLVRLNERLDAGSIRRAVIELPAEARVGEVWSMSPSVANGAVYVPLRAVQRGSADGSPFVLRIADDAGRVASVPIRIGEPRGASIAVLDGLADGDRVIVAGATSIRDGDRVVPVDALR